MSSQQGVNTGGVATPWNTTQWWKQRATNMCYNVGESQSDYAEWKQPGKRRTTYCMLPIIQNSRKGEVMAWQKAEQQSPGDAGGHRTWNYTEAPGKEWICSLSWLWLEYHKWHVKFTKLCTLNMWSYCMPITTQ